MVIRRNGLALAIAGAMCLLMARGATAQSRAAAATIYLVRHGETVSMPDGAQLDARGQARAADVVRTFERVPLTKVFATHTLRARQIVEPAARAHGLDVEQVPAAGARVGDVVISGTTPSQVAIEPLADALRRVPPGSATLVGVNSDNVFGILHQLGVPVATEGAPCVLGRFCVPCLANTCYPPGDFDTLWILRMEAGQATELTWLRFGAR